MASKKKRDPRSFEDRTEPMRQEAVATPLTAAEVNYLKLRVHESGEKKTLAQAYEWAMWIAVERITAAYVELQNGGLALAVREAIKRIGPEDRARKRQQAAAKRTRARLAASLKRSARAAGRRKRGRC